ncbi:MULTISPECIES: hypothetical protein [unclassified Sphingomonas]|uniref:hypothetical protein n=1 Tax=unclassified Sphingomonas TaxID=196159 RepID=UPI000701B06C|nr:MULTISPECIES: hypothetical protein [unclassified Sphingomonas]KQM97598.1 hypothetical protein ASE78_09470 [Sphingomonas sp. Leaf25]KQN37389.1 hypothetical protein ASE97_07310 [Sphingomonas sp. Leaf42]KQT27758.1 hypothetical protein ASG37_10020 [Sphingomonas sp. Leaf407]
MADDPLSPPDNKPAGTVARRTLLIGAASASAVVSIRPALAQTQVSVMNCEIPVPDKARAGRYIAADGSVVAPGTPGAVPPANRPFTGEEVRRAGQGMNLPGADGERTRAYTNYIRRLQSGTSGFTCFASIQMPRG